MTRHSSRKREWEVGVVTERDQEKEGSGGERGRGRERDLLFI